VALLQLAGEVGVQAAAQQTPALASAFAGAVAAVVARIGAASATAAAGDPAADPGAAAAVRQLLRAWHESAAFPRESLEQWEAALPPHVAMRVPSTVRRDARSERRNPAANNAHALCYNNTLQPAPVILPPETPGLAALPEASLLIGLRRVEVEGAAVAARVADVSNTPESLLDLPTVHTLPRAELLRLQVSLAPPYGSIL
jgi:hypothetical protein